MNQFKTIREAVNLRSLAVVCSHLCEGEANIDYAARDEQLDASDSGWQFVCGVDDHSEDAGKVRVLENMLKQDPTLEVIIDAPVGSSYLKQDGVWVRL